MPNRRAIAHHVRGTRMPEAMRRDRLGQSCQGAVFLDHPPYRLHAHHLTVLVEEQIAVSVSGMGASTE